jgi:hypothetical protein
MVASLVVAPGASDYDDVEMIREDRMKRLVMCLCVAAAAIALTAAGASALFELDYNGHFRGKASSYVGFNVKKTASGKRRAVSFTSQGLPFTCDSGSKGSTGFLTLDDPLPIRHGEFDGTSHVFTPQGDPVAQVHGTIDGGIAGGTVSLSGRLDPNDPSASCKADARKWTAVRAN